MDIGWAAYAWDFDVKSAVIYSGCSALNKFLKKWFCINPKIMWDAMNARLVPLECHWQDEVSQSFWMISKKVLKRFVGKEFNQQVFLNLYINDGLHWGDWAYQGWRWKVAWGACGAFLQSLWVISWHPNAIVDPHIHPVHPTPGYSEAYDENVYRQVYNDAYMEVTVYQKGSVVEDWNLIGHQGQTEF